MRAASITPFRMREIRFALLCLMIGIGVVPASLAWAEPRDRQVAEWVILMGGSVRMVGQPERIREVRTLPSEEFQLELVDLVGTNILPPDLQWLIGLKRLKTLNLPGPMWNPSSGAEIDYSKDLGHLASLTTLEELT